MANQRIAIGQSLYFFQNRVAHATDCIILAQFAQHVVIGGMTVPTGREVTFYAGDVARLKTGVTSDDLTLLRRGGLSSFVEAVYRAIQQTVAGTASSDQMARAAKTYAPGGHCANPLLLKGILGKAAAFAPWSGQGDDESKYEKASYYDSIGHMVSTHDGCHAVVPRNRAFHPAVSLLETMHAVHHRFPRVVRFHVPFSEPVHGTGHGGGLLGAA